MMRIHRNLRIHRIGQVLFAAVFVAIFLCPSNGFAARVTYSGEIRDDYRGEPRISTFRWNANSYMPDREVMSHQITSFDKSLGNLDRASVVFSFDFRCQVGASVRDDDWGSYAQVYSYLIPPRLNIYAGTSMIHHEGRKKENANGGLPLGEEKNYREGPNFFGTTAYFNHYLWRPGITTPSITLDSDLVTGLLTGKAKWNLRIDAFDVWSRRPGFYEDFSYMSTHEDNDYIRSAGYSSTIDINYSVHYDYTPHENNTQPTPVPEPASLLLICTGMVGLVGMRPKKKRI